MKPVLRILLIFLMASRVAFGADTGSIVVDIHAADTEAPLSRIMVTIRDKAAARAPLTAATAADGKARFDGLPPGIYVVEIADPKYEPDQGQVTVVAGRAVTYTSLLEARGKAGSQDIKVKANVVLINTSNPNSDDTKRTTTFITTRTAAQGSMQSVVSTAAGVQTDSQGQVHVRGDHKGLGVEVDGINLPFQLESSTSQIIDPRFLDQVDLKVGNFDASQGSQGAVLALTTREGAVEPYVDVWPTVGTYGTYDLVLRAGGSNAKGDVQYFIGARHGETDNRLEPPTPYGQTYDNHGSDTNVLFRITKQTREDSLGLTLAYQNGALGVPQNAANFSAGVRQTLKESNLLGVASWKRAMTDRADFLMGIAYLRSQQQVNNNGVFTPFVAVPEEVSPDLAQASLPLDPEQPGSPYLPSTNLAITQIQPTIEVRFRPDEEQRLKFGATADVIHSSQQVNVLDLGGGGGLPNPSGLTPAPTQFVADVSRNGFFGSLYFSHTFPLVRDIVTVNYGVRADRWDNGLNVRTGQISPRLNLAFAISDTQALRLSYNRLFQPPPLEIDTSGQSFSLPQRTSQYEASYEFQPARETVGKVSLVYKGFTDQLDVGLLIPNSNLPVYAPVNFGSAYYKGAELSLNTTHPLGWNGFLTATFGIAKPTAPGPFNPEVPPYNDHDQRVQLTGGGSYSWKNGLTASMDFLYGSGYPQEAIGLYNAAGINPFGLNGARFSRFITNLNINWMPRGKDGKPTGSGLGLVVQNLFDSRSVLNFLSPFSGTRFVQGRRVLLNGFLRF